MRWLGNIFLVVGLASLVAGLGVRFFYGTFADTITPSAFLRMTDTCVLFAIMFHLKHFIDERAQAGTAASDSE